MMIFGDTCPSNWRPLPGYSLFSRWGYNLLSSVQRAAANPTADNIQHFVGNRVIRKPQLPWTMSTLRTSPSIEGLLLALRDGAGCAVSDGSYYPNEKVGAARCMDYHRWS